MLEGWEWINKKEKNKVIFEIFSCEKQGKITKKDNDWFFIKRSIKTTDHTFKNIGLI